MEPARLLFQEIRELILQKCKSDTVKKARSIFEKEPFGEIERLITQKLLDVAKGVAKQEWKDENWLRVVARINQKSYEEMRVLVLEFLDTDIFQSIGAELPLFPGTADSVVGIDLMTFGVKVVLTPGLGRERIKRVEFVERASVAAGTEPGLKEFLRDASLSGGLTQGELTFLKRLRFDGRRPTKFYYYREVQNLRDPLHFKRKVNLSARTERMTRDSEKKSVGYDFCVPERNL